MTYTYKVGQPYNAILWRTRLKQRMAKGDLSRFTQDIMYIILGNSREDEKEADAKDMLTLAETYPEEQLRMYLRAFKNCPKW